MLYMYCISDNTNYISRKTGDAISVFNKLSSVNLSEFLIDFMLHIL